jgi:HEAT repeat protein
MTQRGFMVLAFLSVAVSALLAGPQVRRISLPDAAAFLGPSQEDVGQSLSIEALIAAAAHDPDPAVREHAAEALGQMGDPRAVGPLVTVALEDGNARVREHAVEALGALGDEGARLALAALMLSDSNARVRRHAAEALGQIGGRPY